MDMRKLTLGIMRCDQCPHSVLHRCKGTFVTWEYRCDLTKYMNNTAILDMITIPKWCPLPDGDMNDKD